MHLCVQFGLLALLSTQTCLDMSTASSDVCHFGVELVTYYRSQNTQPVRLLIQMVCSPVQFGRALGVQ